MCLMRGGRINQDQGQGWVWGWENVIPEEIIVFTEVLIGVCVTGHILLGGLHGGLYMYFCEIHYN